MKSMMITLLALLTGTVGAASDLDGFWNLTFTTTAMPMQK